MANLTALHGSWTLNAHILQSQRVEAASPTKAKRSASPDSLPLHSQGRGDTLAPAGGGPKQLSAMLSSMSTLGRIYSYKLELWS